MVARRGRRRRVVAAAVAIAVVVAAALAVLVTGGRRRAETRPGTLRVDVAGRWVRLRPGTRFGEVAQRFGLEPRWAPLLAIDGSVLRPHAFSRPLLLDGAPVPPSARLHDGDRITAPPARARREPVERLVVPVLDGLPADPEFTLARTPGVDVVLRGKLSHEVLSTQFRPADGAGAPSVPAVALTFDDGPWPRYTPRVLAILRRLRAPATFFTIGYLAAAYPELIRAEAAAGMAIGNHTYNHPQVPPFDELPPRLQDDEIALAADDLRRAGVDTHLFRPPEGSDSRAVVAAAERLGERVVLWSVDPADWRPGVTAREIAHDVLSAVRPGSIVVLHDGGGDRSATVAALPSIIAGIRRRGLALVTVDGL